MAHKVGIDAVSLERATKLAPSFVNHYYSESELIEYNKINNEQTKTEFLASRFAAKEALLKAMGTGLSTFKLDEISLKKEENGKPYLVVEKQVKEYLDKHFRNAKIEVSITHEEPLAIAVVYLEFTEIISE